MKTTFLVTRTSDDPSSKQPCEEAKADTATYKESSNLETSPRTVWSVTLDLVGLLAFTNKYGEIILRPSIVNEIPYELEIYDTYRE